MVLPKMYVVDVKEFDKNEISINEIQIELGTTPSWLS